MADLRDEFGNPVQLTDAGGFPVKLTDEHGNPVHITGLAVSESSGITAFKTEGFDAERRKEETETKASRVQRTTSSSSTSSSSSGEEREEGKDGEGRKKKGLKQKIKEKLGAGKHKEEDTAEYASGGHGLQAPPEHEKKGVMEKIKDMLPGHHDHH